MKTDELRKLVSCTTPGPWSLVEETCYSGKMSGTYFRVWDDDLNAICSEEYGAHNDGGTDNMRLIALAPDLAREVLALREAARHVLSQADELDEASIPALATLRTVLGENE